MHTDNILSWIIYFIVSVIIAWIVFSLVLMWFRPPFYNADGSVNWWTTLWVVAVVIVFAWLITLILAFLFDAIRRNRCRDPCEKPKPKCHDPCEKPKPQC